MNTKSFVNFFIKRHLLMNLITFFILAAGIYAGLTLQREAFPQVEFDIVSVRTIYPGASPYEVERYVTNKIEDAIEPILGIKDIKKSI